jgi:hypothetical protein
MLIYSGIDGLAWLSVEDNTGVRARFEDWVEEYLFAVKAFPCSATDLYAARCGILHTFTGDSHLLARGQAKAIAYAWGDADVAALQRALDRTHRGECCALHINDLAEGLRLATAKLFDDADSDDSLRLRLQGRGARYLQPVTTEFTPGVVPSGFPPGT